MSGIPLFLCHLRFPFHIRDELIKLSSWSSIAVLFQYKEKSPANQCLPSYDDASGRIQHLKLRQINILKYSFFLCT